MALPTRTTPRAPAGRPTSRRPAARHFRLGGIDPATLGVVVLWVSVLVALPIAALLALSLSGGPQGFLAAVTRPSALTTLGLTVALAAAVSLVNAVMGTVIAWVLVRDDFRGKQVLDALIDIPFALPTIVASIVLLSLYGPDSPIGVHLAGLRAGVMLALAFVTLPFVVRAVQPVLRELDTEAEQAAASLGAHGWTIFRRIVWPVLMPAVASGTGLSFARAIGEFGSVVLIGGNLPGRTQVASQYIQQLIEAGDQAGAAAVSVVLLAISFLVLTTLRVTSSRMQQREEAA
ncbi:sulfate transport system permease protein [Raineyella antarctica]|uniref:Sulfate transport system permease protein CysT n=1 Tax=Raineyella antarctica TaxID=1577474 RepID=A0A1G6GEH0_9ACTN|nr:sulfate ABC transporter permease subunit CysT [Raineyella antarctica]SDB80370.1 sulfate transport system permease protein [Raineyella antarctica]